MKKKDKYKIIQSYNYGKTIELKPDSKILNITNLLVITIVIVLELILTCILKMDIISKYDVNIINWLVLPLPIMMLLINATLFNWHLKLEDNIIFIEKDKIFKYKINIDDLIDINEYRNILEIVYLKKNTMRKQNLYLYGFMRKKKALIELLELDEFINCFSYDSIDSNDFYNHTWKNINRDIKKIELIERKLSVNNFFNREASLKDKIIIVALALICMIILFFMIPIIYKVIKGY